MFLWYNHYDSEQRQQIFAPQALPFGKIRRKLLFQKLSLIGELRKLLAGKGVIAEPGLQRKLGQFLRGIDAIAGKGGVCQIQPQEMGVNAKSRFVAVPLAELLFQLKQAE